MKTDATDILKGLADGRPEPSMGSEYMDTPRYLARVRVKVEKVPAHGSNDSDFGAELLRVK